MTIQELYQMRRKTPRFSHGDIRRNVTKKLAGHQISVVRYCVVTKRTVRFSETNLSVQDIQLKKEP